ncbi:MAG: hypothetical protein JKY67_00295 [Pseudomonadales bacterium]|nr:hypothetical protein [Pseudomonadales bacterium]
MKVEFYIFDRNREVRRRFIADLGFSEIVIQDGDLLPESDQKLLYMKSAIQHILEIGRSEAKEADLTFCYTIIKWKYLDLHNKMTKGGRDEG